MNITVHLQQILAWVSGITGLTSAVLLAIAWKLGWKTIRKVIAFFLFLAVAVGLWLAWANGWFDTLFNAINISRT